MSALRKAKDKPTSGECLLSSPRCVWNAASSELGLSYIWVDKALGSQISKTWS